MATPYFQQQSAAYNLYQKQNLHVFTPDGQQYVVSAMGTPYAEYVIEVQDHLMHFEVEALLAQRDSLQKEIQALQGKLVQLEQEMNSRLRELGNVLEETNAELKAH